MGNQGEMVTSPTHPHTKLKEYWSEPREPCTGHGGATSIWLPVRFISKQIVQLPGRARMALLWSHLKHIPAYKPVQSQVELFWIYQLLQMALSGEPKWIQLARKSLKCPNGSLGSPKSSFSFICVGKKIFQRISAIHTYELSWFIPKICAGCTLTMLFYARQEQYINTVYTQK